MAFIEQDAEFKKDTAERAMSIRNIESHHLYAINQSDFLWVHISGGYVGVSTAMEIGYSTALGIPVFASGAVADVTLKNFITIVPSVFEATMNVLGSEEL